MQALFMVLPNLNEAYESFRKISISQLSNLDIHHLEWCGICGRIGKWEFLAIWRYIQLWIHVLANLLVLSRWYININSWKVFSWYSSNTFFYFILNGISSCSDLSMWCSDDTCQRSYCLCVILSWMVFHPIQGGHKVGIPPLCFWYCSGCCFSDIIT